MRSKSLVGVLIRTGSSAWPIFLFEWLQNRTPQSFRNVGPTNFFPTDKRYHQILLEVIERPRCVCRPFVHRSVVRRVEPLFVSRTLGDHIRDPHITLYLGNRWTGCAAD